ncbi:MAG: M1 family aminopeptidase [Candidatus Korobacteraceae bacterium]
MTLQHKPAGGSMARVVFLVGMFLCALSTAMPGQSIPLTSGPVLPLYRALRNVGLDPQRVFQIREAEIDREDIHIWLNDGAIAFTQSVDGKVTGAFFEGEGEVLVRPPDRMERSSLGRFIGAGVLEERFASAYLRFNDNTAKDLEPYLRPPTDAAGFLTRAEAPARALAQVDAMRLCISFTSAPPAPAAGEAASAADRFLHARIAGEHYGVFDVYFDTLSPEQIVVGNTSSQNQQIYYDLWMTFPMRSQRKTPLSNLRFEGPNGPVWTRDVLTVSKYTLSGKLDPPRDLAAEATLDVEVKQSGARMVLFELSRYLQLKQVDADGQPLEYIQNEAVEGSEMSRRGNDVVAVVFSQPLQAGAHFALRFSYAGSVLSDAGGGLLYAGARGTWYPNRGIAMTNYDVTFRFPGPWTVVATGKLVSLQRQGGDFLAHWITEKPIPIAGFNMGVYVRSAAKSGDVEVNAYSARGGIIKIMPPSGMVATSPGPESLLASRTSGMKPEPFPSAASRGQSLADSAAETLTALSQMLGAYPFSTLSLAENPSTDSQGWPGLVFLSSYVYLSPEQRAALNLPPADQIIYGDVMMPHELAHQWFGDKVSWASYHEQWLMEGLANYCSLMLLERTRLADVKLTLQTYRNWLASKSKEGRPNVEAGPVTLGIRLSSSHFPNGYEIITYGRGTWLIHMLRCLLRDASRTAEKPDGDDTAFLALLHNIVDRYQGKEITNTDFQQAIEAVLPRALWFEDRKSLDWFFDGWVNGTAFPQLEVAEVKVARNAGTVKVSGVLRQKLAPPDLVTSVPVYGVTGEQQIYLGRVFAEGDETRFSLSAPAEVKQLVLDPYQTVLTAPQ